MIKSDTIGKVADALRLAQTEFTPILKQANNPFFHSKYATLDAILEATTPALGKHGLTVSQMADGDSLTTLLIHSSGEYIGGSLPLHPVKNDPQGQGSAITYARRYSLSAILNVASEEDDDGNEASHKQPIQNKATPANPKQPETKDDLTKAADVKPASPDAQPNPECFMCGKKITEKVAVFSISKYKQPLCMDCQKKA